MVTRIIRTRPAAATAALFLVTSLVAAGPAIASEEPDVPPSTALPISCEAGLDELAVTETVVEAVQDTGEGIDFVCLDNLASVTVQSDGGDDTIVSMDTDDGEVVDLTGVDPEEYAELAPTVFMEAEYDVPSPPETDEGFEAASLRWGGDLSTNATTIVNGTYQATGETTIYWGQKTSAGVTLWMRSSKLTLRSDVGAERKSTFKATNSPLQPKQIAFEASVDLKKHLRLSVDEVVDQTSFRQTVYSSNTWSETVNLYNNKGAAKYYQNVYNMKMNDREANKKFNIAGNVQMPRFQCYETVVCKYPNGKEAGW
ncbi:hypothetical protein GCM10023081_01600 [Arthrobacter ginkgonis]|uniref:Uncharacterized protein n=1 Tax=Arthrobacter ginkgonis TaxID=1630594 RepID=A0ABP7BPA7_9MICC